LSVPADIYLTNHSVRVHPCTLMLP
jgi:hypothetical protein